MLFSLAVRRDAGLKLLVLRWYDVLVKGPLRAALRRWRLNEERAVSAAFEASWESLLGRTEARRVQLRCLRDWQAGAARRRRARTAAATLEARYRSPPFAKAFRRWRGYDVELRSRLRAYDRLRHALCGAGRRCFKKWAAMVLGHKRLLAKAARHAGRSRDRALRRLLRGWRRHAADARRFRFAALRRVFATHALRNPKREAFRRLRTLALARRRRRRTLPARTHVVVRLREASVACALRDVHRRWRAWIQTRKRCRALLARQLKRVARAPARRALHALKVAGDAGRLADARRRDAAAAMVRASFRATFSWWFMIVHRRMRARSRLRSCLRVAARCRLRSALGRWRRAATEESATFPTSKAPISAVSHSFRLTFGRAIISRNGLEAWMLFPERARAEHSH